MTTPGESAAAVVVLGSAGGPTPKVGRRPVAHVLDAGDGLTLIDCGNGVAGQLVEAGFDLSRLRRILVTHHHIDHVADVALLLHLAWTQLTEPVHVIGPPPLAELFELHYQAFDLDIRSRMHAEAQPHLREMVRITEIDTATTVHSGVATITAALVEHPPIELAFGYRVDVDKYSVCFSGDTRPCAAVVTLAAGVDLLVHETTFLDNALDFLPAARAERVLPRMRSVHSEPAGAGVVAASARAHELLLSPVGAFGPTSDADIIADARTQYDGPISVGRDFLRVPLLSQESSSS